MTGGMGMVFLPPLCWMVNGEWKGSSPFPPPCIFARFPPYRCSCRREKGIYPQNGVTNTKGEPSERRREKTPEIHHIPKSKGCLPSQCWGRGQRGIPLWLRRRESFWDTRVPSNLNPLPDRVWAGSCVHSNQTGIFFWGGGEAGELGESPFYYSTFHEYRGVEISHEILNSNSGWWPRKLLPFHVTKKNTVQKNKIRQ